MKKLLNKIKSIIPVSRARYGRELSLLRLSVSRSVADERSHLEHLIHNLTEVTHCGMPSSEMTRVSASISVDLNSPKWRNPMFRGQIIYHVALEIARAIDKQIGRITADKE